MTGERDIAGFALPFAAGTFLASLIPYSQIYGTSASAAILLIFPTGALLCRKFQHLSTTMQYAAIILAALCTGMLCHNAATLCSICSLERSTGIEAIAIELCQRFTETIDSISFEVPETAALLKALTAGDKSTLPRELSQTFRDSGAAHILALSGMHLGIIYGILAKIFSCTGNSIRIKRIRSMLLIGTCGFYTLATGAGDSITRAFLFILLNETAGLMLRKTSLTGIMMAALIIQLTFDPTSIRSVGFQLSYAAIAGIAFINPRLRAFWPYDGNRKGLMGRIWESASISISCQITTAPLAWYHFSSLPHNFLIANLIAIPLTTLIIPFALLTAILDAAGICPHMLIRLTEFLTTAMTRCLDIIAVM